MEVVIRKAVQEDCKSIFSLIQELAVFEKAPEAVIITEADLEAHGFGTHPLFECFVAEVAGVVVGIALFYPRYSTWKGPTLHLEDLIVTQQMRGKGIGSELYANVIQYAASKGVQRIEWVVLDWNTPAIAFYEQSGATVLPDWRTVQMDADGMSQFIEKRKKDERI